MFGRGAGIVAQPGETEIGAQRVEQRQRLRRGRVGAKQAVGQLVADFSQVGGRKKAREFQRRDAPHVRPVAGVEHIGERNLLPRLRDGKRYVIMAREQQKLFAQIVGKQVGTRHGGDEGARAVEPAEGKIVARLPRARLARGDEPQRRIGEQAACGGIGRRQGAVVDIGGDGGFQVGDRRAIGGLQLADDGFDGGGRVGTAGR